MIKTQLTLYVQNKPGELARVTKTMTAAELNIEGISVAGTADIGLVQIIVSDAEAARQALQAAGIPITEQKVLVLAVSDKPGELAKMAAKLADHRINVNYLYLTTPPKGAPADCSMVLSTDDLERVESILSQ